MICVEFITLPSEYLTGMKIDSSPPVTTTGLEGEKILNKSVINSESASRHAELKCSAEMRRPAPERGLLFAAVMCFDKQQAIFTRS